jgi:hypothetical protein
MISSGWIFWKLRMGWACTSSEPTPHPQPAREINVIFLIDHPPAQLYSTHIPPTIPRSSSSNDTHPSHDPKILQLQWYTSLPLSQDSPAPTIHIPPTIPRFSSLNYPHSSNYPKILLPQLSTFLKLSKDSLASTIHIPQIIQRFSSLNYPHSSNYLKIL